MSDTAYDGIEALDSFPDRASLERYREGLLQRTAHQTAVLAPLLPDDGRVVEVGCGNGRLLLALAEAGRLAEGLGIDVATSRIEFARRWAADRGVAGISFEAADALRSDLGTGADATVCITGALGYFGATAPRSDGDLLQRLAAATRPGGLLCLELYPHPVERRVVEAAGGELRTWHELPADDPWRFYLSSFVLRAGVLDHAKTFVHRHDGTVDTGRSERLYLYDEAEVRRLLGAAGFEAVECREGWSDAAYAGGDLLLVLARRAG